MYFSTLVPLLIISHSWLSLAQNVGRKPWISEDPKDTYVAKNKPATLECKAEGSPPPDISWYKDGELVVTNEENPNSHRMLLPDGGLFFLRVIHNKNQRPDLGVYYCNATNIHGSAVSRNATLQVAVLRDEFREMPRNTRVAVGERAALSCRAPRGSPTPLVTWEKQGTRVTQDGVVTIDSSGDLLISSARREHSGSYVCVARNIAGERYSSAAILAVQEKPEFEEMPSPVEVAAGNDVTLRCRVRGDPAPTVVWLRKEGPISPDRAHPLPDHSLRITGAQVSDSGTYVCKAENEVGFVQANAKLDVFAEPSFVVTPVDKTVGEGRSVSFMCVVAGNPPPAKFWSKEGQDKALMYPGQERDHHQVASDGTLIIRGARPEDAGSYICQAINTAGRSITKATLTVDETGSAGDNIDPEARHWILHRGRQSERDMRPPPVVYLGPQNQTVGLGADLILPCSSRSSPPPEISWEKDGVSIQSSGSPRVTPLGSGQLQISDVRPGDAGRYTCRAVSVTGEASWSAYLTTADPAINSAAILPPEVPADLPGPPSRPLVSDVTATSLRLTWQPAVTSVSSQVSGYVVEYYSHDLRLRGWQRAADAVSGRSLVIRGLAPGTSYFFVVRARNPHGVGPPSDASDTVRTIGGERERPELPVFESELVERRLAGQLVRLYAPEVMSPAAIMLNWDLNAEPNEEEIEYFIEGFAVQYRERGEATWRRKEVLNNLARLSRLEALTPGTEYELRVRPFYHGVEGAASRSVRARTLEDVPSQPPRSVRGEQEGRDGIRVTWDPPPKQHWNGKLLGYKVYCESEDGEVAGNATVTSETRSAVVSGLTSGESYSVQVLAYTAVGDGVASDKGYVVKIGASGLKPWLLGALIGGIGVVVWVLLCVLSVWLLRRRRRCKKKVKELRLTGPQTPDMYPNKSIIFKDTPGRPDVTNVIHEASLRGGPGHVASLQARPLPVVPAYASADLLQHAFCSQTGSSFRGMGPGYREPGQPGGSSDSCHKMEPHNSSDHSTEHTDLSRDQPSRASSSHYASIGPGTSAQHAHYTHGGSSPAYREPGSLESSQYAAPGGDTCHPPTLRLGDLLPPPPSHPPEVEHMHHPSRYEHSSPGRPVTLSDNEYSSRVPYSAVQRDFHTFSPRAHAGYRQPDYYDNRLEHEQVEEPLLTRDDTSSDTLMKMTQPVADTSPLMCHGIGPELGYGEDYDDLDPGLSRDRSPGMSSSGEVEVNDSMRGSWASGGGGASPGASQRSSVISEESTDSLQADQDFALALARAAAQQGMQVQGTTVHMPGQQPPQRQGRRQQRRQRARQRASSPYSTDSNMSSVPPHRPCPPRAQRRRQMQAQAERTQQAGDSRQSQERQRHTPRPHRDGAGTPTSHSSGSHSSGRPGTAGPRATRAHHTAPHISSHGSSGYGGSGPGYHGSGGSRHGSGSLGAGVYSHGSSSGSSHRGGSHRASPAATLGFPETAVV